MAKRTRHRAPQSLASSQESEIIESYLRVACRVGVDHVTLKKVAVEAGVAYSTVHYYFGQSSTSLVDRAIEYVAKASEHYMHQKLEAVANVMTQSSLFAFVEAKFEWNRKFPTYASLLFYFFYLTTRDPNIKNFSTSLYQSSLKRIQTLCLQDSGKGIFGKIHQSEQLAANIQIILSGSLLTDASSDANQKGDIHNLAMKLIQEQIKLYSHS